MSNTYINTSLPPKYKERTYRKKYLYQQDVPKNLQGVPKKGENHPNFNEIKRCYFYRYRGFCKFQENCKYLHGQKIQKKCRYFLKDRCWFAEKCWYLHKSSEEIKQPPPKNSISKLVIADHVGIQSQGKIGNNGKCLDTKNTLLIREVKKLKLEIKQLKQSIKTLTSKVKNVFKKKDTQRSNEMEKTEAKDVIPLENKKKTTEIEATSLVITAALNKSEEQSPKEKKENLKEKEEPTSAQVIEETEKHSQNPPENHLICNEKEEFIEKRVNMLGTWTTVKFPVNSSQNCELVDCNFGNNLRNHFTK